MSARTRILAVVAVIAAAAAAVVVGAAALSGGDDERAAEPRPRAGHPPLSLEAGPAHGRRGEGSAPGGLALRGRAPRGGRGACSPATSRWRRGSGRCWPPGRATRSTASTAWSGSARSIRAAASCSSTWGWRGCGRRGAIRPRPGGRSWRATPTRPYAVTAGDLLHPEYARGLPIFVPRFRAPAELQGLSAPRQLEALKDGAQSSFATEEGRRWKLLYGVALQRLGHARSAEAVYAEAAQGCAERPRGADRRGRRPLHEGRPGARVLAARPAQPPLSQGRDRPLPPRAAAALDGTARRGEASAAARARGAAGVVAGPRGRPVPRDARQGGWDLLTAPNEPIGPWRERCLLETVPATQEDIVDVGPDRDYREPDRTRGTG